MSDYETMKGVANAPKLLNTLRFEKRLAIMWRLRSKNMQRKDHKAKDNEKGIRGENIFQYPPKLSITQLSQSNF